MPLDVGPSRFKQQEWCALWHGTGSDAGRVFCQFVELWLLDLASTIFFSSSWAKITTSGLLSCPFATWNHGNPFKTPLWFFCRSLFDRRLFSPNEFGLESVGKVYNLFRNALANKILEDVAGECCELACCVMSLFASMLAGLMVRTQ